MSKRDEFSAKVKEEAYRRSGGRCEHCGIAFSGRRPEYHHVLECAFEGNGTLSNCLVVCRGCHAIFSAAGIKRIRKADRVRRASIGAERAKAKIPQRPKAEKTVRDRPPMPDRKLDPYGGKIT